MAKRVVRDVVHNGSPTRGWRADTSKNGPFYDACVNAWRPKIERVNGCVSTTGRTVSMTDAAPPATSFERLFVSTATGGKAQSLPRAEGCVCRANSAACLDRPMPGVGLHGRQPLLNRARRGRLLLRDRHGRDGRTGKKPGIAVGVEAPIDLIRDQRLRWLSEETSRRSRSGWNRFANHPDAHLLRPSEQVFLF
jgi:hypothetical protein